MHPQDLLVVFVLCLFVVTAYRAWQRVQRQAPLREKAQAHEATFYIRLDRVRVSVGSGWGEWNNMSPYLAIRGDLIEISSSVPVFRAVFSGEYYFKASDTSMDAERPPFFRQSGGGRWIVLIGMSDGKDIQVAICSRNSILDIWNALSGSGVVACSLPPGLIS